MNLTIGDYEGKGKIRTEELYECCKALGLHSSVFITDHIGLRDGPNEHWSPQVISSMIERHINKMQRVDFIVTFDILGVSGHCNHRDTAFGVEFFMQSFNTRKPSQDSCALQAKLENTKALYLETTNILRKYSGVLDIFYSYCMMSWLNPIEQIVIITSPLLIITTIRALIKHWSQLVWYRLLFVIFARYTYVNTFSTKLSR